MQDPIVNYANDQLAYTGQAGGGKSTVPEGTQAYERLNQLGEQYVRNVDGAHVIAGAREGSQWVVSNVQGTALSDPNASGFVATTPVMIIVNTNPVGGAWIYPLRLTAEVTVVGASSTNFLGQWLVDSGNRYSSGNTALTPQNVNMNVLNGKTGALVYFGSPTATAANSSRVINNHKLRTVIPVAGDQYEFIFGSSAPGIVAEIMAGSAQYQRSVPVVGVALPPQTSLLWYSWGASEGTARQFDNIAFTYLER